MGDLEEMARSVIDTNRYMVLGTTSPDGSPRVSPVYFTHHEYRDFYWVSGPDARHSLNVVARPSVNAVIFDSTAAVGQGRAVYLTGETTLIADEDLPRHCELAFATTLSKGARPFTPDELSGDGALRLFMLSAARHEVHIRGADPVYGKGIDTRREISLP
jgi:nitroimidazol reductase NimA-like FMN-containing flavoprotein (pyridoxamine 5'-phosphate oxidase superfamily)